MHQSAAMKAPRRRRFLTHIGSRFVRDQRGSMMTEYLLAVALIGLGCAGAFVARGQVMITDYELARNLTLVPSL
jgi:hypothetical protein